MIVGNYNWNDRDHNCYHHISRDHCLKACNNNVAHSECFYSTGKQPGPVCARCICTNDIDKSSSMPMQCTSNTCNYPQGQGGCPEQSTSSKSSLPLAEVVV